MITIEHLYKSFKDKSVLKDISMNIEAGEFVVILGSSGAGKSTLLRCMNGLYLPEQGSITISDTKLTKKSLREVRKKVGFIFQGSCVIGNLSVLTNVLTGCLGKKHAFSLRFSAEETEKALQMIELVGLSEYAYVHADKLSGGQRQRVGIARALLQEPCILLADEPVASLDPVTGREILELLHNINTELKTTVICNLHQIDYAKEYGKRIIGIRDGKIAFDEASNLMTTEQLTRIYGSAN